MFFRKYKVISDPKDRIIKWKMTFKTKVLVLKITKISLIMIKKLIIKPIFKLKMIQRMKSCDFIFKILF